MEVMVQQGQLQVLARKGTYLEDELGDGPAGMCT